MRVAEYEPLDDTHCLHALLGIIERRAAMVRASRKHRDRHSSNHDGEERRDPEHSFHRFASLALRTLHRYLGIMNFTARRASSASHAYGASR